MQPGEKISLLLKLILPLLVLASLSAYPLSYAVVDGLKQQRLAQRADRPHEAARALRQVVEHEPWRADLWEPIGLAELAAGSAPDSAAALQRAADLGQLSAEGRFRLGEAYELAGDPGAAEAAWQKLLALDGIAPDVRARVFDRLAQVQREQGDFAAAAVTLRAWLNADPGNARAAYLLGLHLTIVEPEEAVSYLIDASQANSMYTPAMQKIRSGLSLAAEVDDPGYDWVVIGRALGSAGEWDLAAEAFRLATEAAPQYAEAWAFLAEARYQTGGSGRQALERAAALDSRSVIVRTLVALDYRRQGKPGQALAFLEEVAAQEPQEPIWQVELANLLVETGDLQGALDRYQKAVELAPATSLYWQYLARFSAEYGMNVRYLGVEAARQAVLLAPDDPGALDVMGLVRMSLADLASAERFFQQAVDRDAAYAPAQLHLGQLYLQQNDLDRAYPHLRRASDLDGQAAVGTIARRLLIQYYGEGS